MRSDLSVQAGSLFYIARRPWLAPFKFLSEQYCENGPLNTRGSVCLAAISLYASQISQDLLHAG